MKSTALMILIFTTCFLTAQIAITPSAGNGTEENPYEIASLGNLYWIAASDDIVPNPNRAARWSSHYNQTANIDASATANWFEGQGWSTIGTHHNSPSNFRGSYNGQGYTIDAIFINRPNSHNVGLFGGAYGALFENINVNNMTVVGVGYVGGIIGICGNSVIRNCNVNANVSGSYSVGGLIGHVINETTIENCTSSGSVVIVNPQYGAGVGGLIGAVQNRDTIRGCSSSTTVYGQESGGSGGLIGRIYSIVENSYSTGHVYGNNVVGGLVGQLRDDGRINNCYSTGQVSGSGQVGGLVGYVDHLYSYLDEVQVGIYNSFSTGNVIGTGDDVGGLVGFIYHQMGGDRTTLNGCISTGQVTGNENVGGLIGRQRSYSHISNSYSKSHVSGLNRVGGLVGNSERSAIINCYSVGRVSGDTDVGGLVGMANTSHGYQDINNYWNIETSGQISSITGNGRTTSAMTYPYATNTYVDWDFDEVWDYDTFYINNGYPYIQSLFIPPQTEKHLSGTVKDSLGVPVEGVTIHLHTGQGLIEETLSDSSGNYSFGIVYGNQVSITAVKEGYQTATRTIVLNPGSNYCHLVLLDEGHQVSVIQLTDALTIQADTVEQNPSNYYTLTGNVTINDILLLQGSVTVDKRAHLVHPRLIIWGGTATGININGNNPVIIPNIGIPLVYSVRDDQLVPTHFDYFAESDDEVCGFTIEIGRLKISETQSMGKYIEVMGLVKTADEGFFAKILDKENWSDAEQAPHLFLPDLESVSVSIHYAENTGVSYGCNIQGVSCNFGAFSVESFSLWIDPSEDIFGGRLKLKIPGVGNLRRQTELGIDALDLPVNITDTDTGQIYGTDLDGFIEMHRQGIFSHLEIDAMMEFGQGQLNSLSIALGGMNIPIFNTGTFIREIRGGVYDMAVNDLRIEASVDIGLHSSLDIPALGPVVYLDDLGVVIKPWNYFQGSGTFNVFKQPVSDGKLYYDGGLAALGLEANLMLMAQMNNPESTILRGQMYGNISTSNFNAGLNAQIQTPNDLPWYLWWAAGISLASADVSIHNFELSTMLQYYKLSLAQKFVYGNPTFPYFHYHLGSNYENMYQLWKGARNGIQTIDFQVPENAKQILIVAGNDSNLFDFTITSPSNIVYDNTHSGYQQFATTNQTILVIDYPEQGDWSFSTEQTGEIVTAFKVIDQAPSALISMPATRGSRDNTIKLSLTDYSNTLNVEVYYNTNNRYFDGVFIQEFTVLNNADLEFVWHNDHLDNGEYYIYARIDDGKNAPVLQYAPGSIMVSNYHVPVPQNVNATMLNGELVVSWDTPHQNNIILTEILLEDVYNQSRYSYSVMGLNNYSIAALPIGREYEVSCRFVNNLYQKSDYSSAGTIVFGDGTRNVPPYFTMDKDELWWFVENQPKSYSLSSANPAGGTVNYYLPESQTGMNISGNSFNWAPSSHQKGFYQQPLVVSNGSMTDTLYQQIVVYSAEQAEVKISFSSFNLYEADRMFVKINNLFSDEPFQIVSLTNLSSDTQIAVTCRRVNKFEYIGQFSLSVLNRSEIPVSDGDEIEAFYTFNGNTYTAISIYSSEPQTSDRIAPASITDLEVITIDVDNIKLRWTATGDDDHNGRAYRYDLRYSYQPIQTNDHFFIANLYPTNIYPTEPGMIDSLTINIQDLFGVHQYDMLYFALVVEDANQNRSNISNCVSYAYLASPMSVDISLVNDAFVEISWNEVIPPRDIQNLNTKSERGRAEADFSYYQLWREHNGSLGLLADSLSVVTYTDSITSLSDGNLRYGVKALYANGVSSMRQSNELQLNRLTDIRILCQQDSLSPASNVQYSIVGQDDLYNHNFIGQTNPSGIILLDNVYQSSYRISLGKPGCFPAVYLVDFINSEPEIVLDIYTALAPETVLIELIDDLVFLSWEPVRGASYYLIYASDDPTAEGALINTQSETSIVIPMQGDKMFFKVVAGQEDE